MAPHSPQRWAGPDMAPHSPQRWEGPDMAPHTPRPLASLSVRANFIPKSLEEPAAPVREDDQREQRLHEVFLAGGVAADVAGNLRVVHQP